MSSLMDELRDTKLPRIFIVSQQLEDGRYEGQALAEDGTGLHAQEASHPMWLPEAMGLTSDRHWLRLRYAKHYPAGYTLVNLLDATDEDLTSNEAYMKALKLNEEGK